MMTYFPGMLDQLMRSALHVLEPLGFIWICLWIGTVLLWRRKQRLLALGCAAIAVLLFVFGCTPVPGLLLASLERPYIVKNLDDLPLCDAVVALGGGVQPSRHEAFGLDVKASGDRIVMAVELVRRGKAPNLVLGGATQRVDGMEYREADLTADWLAAWQVTGARVFNLDSCENTHDEALRTAALMKEHGWKRILLVTSAFHMRRAEAVFRTAGVPVVPVACDFQTDLSVLTGRSIQLVPRPGGFMKTELWFHEKVGWLIYRLRGWIKTQATEAPKRQVRPETATLPEERQAQELHSLAACVACGFCVSLRAPNENQGCTVRTRPHWN